MSLSEHWLTASDGFRLFYRRSTAEHKRAAMVLVHGRNLHSGFYLDLAGYLAGIGISVVMPDLRGRGKSVAAEWKVGETHSLPRMVQDLSELRTANADLCFEVPFFMAGISFGSLLAVKWATHANDLAGLLISGPPFGTVNPAFYPLLNLLGLIAPDFPVRRAPLPEEVYARYEAQSKMREDVNVNREALRAQAAADIARMMFNLEKDMAKITVPTLIVYGTKDKLVKLKQLDIIKRRWGTSDCTILVAEGLGHDVFSEIAYDDAKAMVRDWLQNHMKIPLVV